MARGTLSAAALLLLVPTLGRAYTTYDNLADWQAAVGTHQLESFDDEPDQGIPPEGGTIAVDGFTIYADANHSTNYESCTGYVCPPKIEDGFFRGDIHGNTGEVSINRFDFDHPITALALELFDVEDEFLGLFGDGFDIDVYVSADDYYDAQHTYFVGLVLDAPAPSLEFGADYQGFSVDNVRWVTVVPEPSTGLLVAVVVLGLAAWRRGRA